MTDAVRQTVGMHVAVDEIRVAVASPTGGSTVVDALSSTVHQIDGEIPTAVESYGRRGLGGRADVVSRLGEPALVALHDTWFPAEHLVRVLMVAARELAQTLCGRTLTAVGLAHPAHWDQRRLDLIRRIARRTGFVDVALVPAAEAAAWAPVAGVPPSPRTGLALAFDLGREGSVALVERSRGGQRVLALISTGARPPGAVAGDLLRMTGHTFADVGQACVAGAGATDSATVSTLVAEIGRPVRVVDGPRYAIAAGALVWAAAQQLP